jgi:hypothetical protein
VRHGCHVLQQVQALRVPGRKHTIRLNFLQDIRTQVLQCSAIVLEVVLVFVAYNRRIPAKKSEETPNNKTHSNGKRKK